MGGVDDDADIEREYHELQTRQENMLRLETATTSEPTTGQSASDTYLDEDNLDLQYHEVQNRQENMSRRQKSQNTQQSDRPHFSPESGN